MTLIGAEAMGARPIFTEKKGNNAQAFPPHNNGFTRVKKKGKEEEEDFPVATLGIHIV